MTKEKVYFSLSSTIASKIHHFLFLLIFFGGVNQLEIVMSYFHQVIRDSGISILQVIHLNPDLIATITFVYDYSKPNIYVDRASHNST